MFCPCCRWALFLSFRQTPLGSVVWIRTIGLPEEVENCLKTFLLKAFPGDHLDVIEEQQIAAVSFSSSPVPVWGGLAQVTAMGDVLGIAPGGPPRVLWTQKLSSEKQKATKQQRKAGES